MLPCKAFISSLASTFPNQEEQAFIRDERPWGFILFSRNIDHEDETQLHRLTDALRTLTNRDDVAIFVDQEGGRVQRLRPPLVPHYPPARQLGKLYTQDKEAGLRAAFLQSRLHAFDLQRFGLNANCLPLLDVAVTGSHDVIGNRAYGHDSAMVASLGEATANGLLTGGVLPVMKHIPGHGRTLCDTHLQLARVDAPLDLLQKSDFIPFQHLRHLPAAMSAHIVYEAIDSAQPATLSAKVIGEIIRKVIGFDGLLISDDLSMQALSGTLAQRARESLNAGCDMVLYCHGKLAEMREVAGEAQELADKVLVRVEVAQASIRRVVDKDDEAVLQEEFTSLVAQVE